MRIRSVLYTVIIGVAAAAAYSVLAQPNQADPAKEETKIYHIMSSQILAFPALDQAREGAKQALAEAGFVEGSNLKWTVKNASGDRAANAAIAKDVRAKAPDAVLAISTPSAQVLAQELHGAIPMVITAVSDPIAAGLVKTVDTPTANITGVLDRPDIEKTLACIDQLLKRFAGERNSWKVGALYNAGEPNSYASVERFKQLASAHNVELICRPIATPSELIGAVQNLLPQVDALYVPQDNMVVSAIRTVCKQTLVYKQHNGKGVPIIGNNKDLIEGGASMVVGFDYHDIGRQTGRVLAHILKSEKPTLMPLQMPEKTQVYMNEEMLDKLGFSDASHLTANIER